MLTSVALDPCSWTNTYQLFFERSRGIGWAGNFLITCFNKFEVAAKKRMRWTVKRNFAFATDQRCVGPVQSETLEAFCALVMAGSRGTCGRRAPPELCAASWWTSSHASDSLWLMEG